MRTCFLHPFKLQPVSLMTRATSSGWLALQVKPTCRQSMTVHLNNVTPSSPHSVVEHSTGASLHCHKNHIWAAERKTTHVEDRTYPLMGLFAVNMPHHGVARRKEESFSASATGNHSGIQRSQYVGVEPQTGSVLAGDPSDFGDCGDIKKVEPDEFAGVSMIESQGSPGALTVTTGSLP
ncbi:hypothetical protein BKA83DRAFT_4322013 [Pisolithus microcarpus]|nr:hypothetical protein BKA83DRAFT_4322013 [Pisolithus microcarpus]